MRYICTSTPHSAAVALAIDHSREELSGLVDQYPVEEEEAHIRTTLNALDKPIPGKSKNKKPHPEVRNSVARLVRVFDNENTPAEYVMETYYELPSPGVQYLTPNLIRKLRNRLATVAHKDEASKIRYLNVITDCRAANKPIPVSAWTTAIAFAGHCVKRISAVEIETSLNLWKQMESEAGVKANAVTFNLLFDTAAKARKFVLADMIQREMLARGLPMDRFFRVSLIYYHGLRRDGSGVRRAYKELVEAGETVDTAVVTCVIAALLRAGEPTAAEQTFERAKRLHAQKSGSQHPPLLPRRSNTANLGRSLGSAAPHPRDSRPSRISKNNPSNHDARPNLAPTIRTYRALIYYYSVTAGDISRVAALVAELEAAHLPLHGAFFLYIFKGFAMHGGLLYSGWTRARLEGALGAFVRAVKAERGGGGEGDGTGGPGRDVLGDGEEILDDVEEIVDVDRAIETFTDDETLPIDDAAITDPDATTGLDAEIFQPDTMPDDRDSTVYISKAMVELCLCAFARTAGIPRTREVWLELQSLWLGADLGEVMEIERLIEELAQREVSEARGEGGRVRGKVARGRHFWLR